MRSVDPQNALSARTNNLARPVDVNQRGDPEEIDTDELDLNELSTNAALPILFFKSLSLASLSLRPSPRCPSPALPPPMPQRSLSSNRVAPLDRSAVARRIQCARRPRRPPPRSSSSRAFVLSLLSPLPTLPALS